MLQASLSAVVFAFLLAFPGSRQLSEETVIIRINALKAAPRWGNNACWVDTGARLKNNCNTKQLLSFMPEQDLAGKTVVSVIGTDAPFAKLKCQHVSLKDSGLDNYWVLGPSQSNGNPTFGISSVFLEKWKVPLAHQYQIDCQVPPGMQVLGATITGYP
jgi:hypothetical protein